MGEREREVTTVMPYHSRYKTWLPDTTGDMDSLTKFTYYIGIKMSNQTGQWLLHTHQIHFKPSSSLTRLVDNCLFCNTNITYWLF